MDVAAERALAGKIARRVRDAGGRAYFVGGLVRDALMGRDCKDIDLEIYGITPKALRALLAEFGEVFDKGKSFGVLGLRHFDLDIAQPRKERCVGAGHKDFDVSVDPFLSVQEASRRRDFTVNAMMMDVLTGEIVDPWGGQSDLKAGLLRCVSEDTFAEDALRVFRCAQFAARFAFRIDDGTLALCRGIDTASLSVERVFEETAKALLKAKEPSRYFRALQAMGQLGLYFRELQATIGVRQNPIHHPEGDVFEHTMRVVDQAALLRDQAREPLAFMLSALFHDLGKCVATKTLEDGRIVAYGHEKLGLPLVERQMRRLTNNKALIEYVVNQSLLHMRPNMLAAAHSRRKKTRAMFDLSVCPEDLLLLARADALGKQGEVYAPETARFLLDRLEDYRRIMQKPMVTGEDLLRAGVAPGPLYGEMLARARALHFAGWPHQAVLKQVLQEFAGKYAGNPPKTN